MDTTQDAPARDLPRSAEAQAREWRVSFTQGAAEHCERKKKGQRQRFAKSMLSRRDDD